MAILLALMASVAWGSADFLGGLLGRRCSLWSLVLISQLAGLAGCLTLVAVCGSAMPSLGHLAPALMAGLFSPLALATVYKALAIGKMSIVAPITAASGAVPLLVGLASGESPTPLQLAGIIAVLGGAMLAAHESHDAATVPTVRSPFRRPASAPSESTTAPIGNHRSSIVLAVVAALSIGVFLTGLHAASGSDPYWALLAARLTSSTVIVVAVLARRPRLALRGAPIWPMVALGLIETAANGLFAVASVRGYLSIVAVLGSLYPVTTIACAYLLLGERVVRWQRVGIVVALVGVAMMAAG